MQEAIKSFQVDAKRKHIDYRVAQMDDIPNYLVGDPRRIRQVVSNIIANAIQNTSTGFVKVEVCKSLKDSGPGKIVVQFAVEDTGAGMPQEKVDALFRELEQVSPESKVLHSTVLEKNHISKSPRECDNKATLGLGFGGRCQSHPKHERAILNPYFCHVSFLPRERTRELHQNWL